MSSKLPIILRTVYTTHELREKTQFLKTYLKQQLFGTNKDLSVFSSQNLTWLSAQPKELLTDITTENVDQIFEDVEKDSKELKSLVIFVPSELPSQTIADITSNLRKNYGENFLTDFKIDPNLIAGCALVWNGTYKDYSIRAKINEMRGDILTILKEWR